MNTPHLWRSWIYKISPVDQNNNTCRKSKINWQIFTKASIFIKDWRLFNDVFHQAILYILCERIDWTEHSNIPREKQDCGSEIRISLKYFRYTVKDLTKYLIFTFLEEHSAKKNNSFIVLCPECKKEPWIWNRIPCSAIICSGWKKRLKPLFFCSKT